jgi:hypothetical protein
MQGGGGKFLHDDRLQGIEEEMLQMLQVITKSQQQREVYNNDIWSLSTNVLDPHIVVLPRKMLSPLMKMLSSYEGDMKVLLISVRRVLQGRLT